MKHHHPHRAYVSAQKSQDKNTTENKKKPSKLSLPDKALRALELPVDTLTGMAHIELVGNREVVVDGCKGILEYDENVIRINTGKMIVKFLGTQLSLKNLTRDSVTVQGLISSLEFQI